MINAALISYLQDLLTQHCGCETIIVDHYSIHGGDINQAYKLESAQGSFFLKLNKAKDFPTMFEAECRGLKELSNKTDFTIPSCILHGEQQNITFLLMKYLPLSRDGNWKDFGQVLAGMHSVSDGSMGLSYSNYIGSIVQKNDQQESWASFYSESRLMPLTKKAFDMNLITKNEVDQMERLCKRLDSIYPKEKAALLHGDLWSGNVSFCEGKPCIYDPAIYYGHREMDIAMTLLFGAFPSEMYQGYNEVYPLESSWKSRVGINQLYPLLVHLLLFGSSYKAQIKAIIKSF
jgi:fructosamine-3-kinase